MCNFYWNSEHTKKKALWSEWVETFQRWAMWTLKCVDTWLCSAPVYAHLTLPPPLAHGHLSVQLPQVFFKSCIENRHFVPAYSVPFLGSGFLESGGMNDLRYVGCCFANQRTSKVLRVQFHQPLTSLPNWWTYVKWGVLSLFFGHAWSSLLHGLFSSWGEWKLLTSCGAQLSHCSGFSRCVKWGFLNDRWIWLPCGVYISHNAPLPVPILRSSIVMLSH